jgi:hypothetical protein
MPDDRIQALDLVLKPAGFRRRGNRYLRPNPDGSHQVVALKRSRTGDGTASIYMMPREDVRFEEISPVSPFKNTYWWPEELAESRKTSLIHQLSQVALPYLDSFRNAFDEAVAAESIHSILAAFCSLDHSFQRKGNVYFRERGKVIDLVEVEPVGQHRFVFVWVAVWHKNLAQGINRTIPTETRIPDGVTRVTAQTIGVSSVDEAPCSSLFFLGAPSNLASSPAPGIIEVALRFFDNIQTERDVLNQIRPEFRSRFPP